MRLATIIAATNWRALTDGMGSAEGIPELINSLVGASNRSVARNISWELTTRIAPTSGAIESATAPTVKALIAAMKEPQFRWKADVLSLLDCVADLLGAWERATERWQNQPETHSDVRLGPEWERHVTVSLHGFLPTVRDLLDDDDAEVRAMAAALYADSIDKPAEAVGELRNRFEAEPHVITRAVLAEATLRSMSRCDDPAVAASMAAWANELCGHPEPAIRFRIARMLLSQLRPASDSSLKQIMDQAYEEAGHNTVWPAEV